MRYGCSAGPDELLDSRAGAHRPIKLDAGCDDIT